MQNSIIWLVVGALCVALEAFGVSGVGLFFAGLAALCVAVIVESGVAAHGDFTAQLIWFFGLTVAWAALLWKPMKRFRLGSKDKPFSNIVGETAVVVGDGLRKGQEGQVQWSGTLMRAAIAADETAESFESGARVAIAEVEGNKLYVKRKA
jgi:membrane protein implicated in regulation of membrane protease activity